MAVGGNATSQTLGFAGLGHWWVKADGTKFFTDAGVGYTKETPVLSQPDASNAFATFRLGAKLEQKVFETSLHSGNQWSSQ